MKQPKVLINDGEQQEFVNFDFVISDANGVYIVDSETMGVVINGNDFILQFNSELYTEIKRNIKVRNTMNKN